MNSNILSILSSCELLKALGNAISHSLWQGLLISLVLYALLRWCKGVQQSRLRYRMASAALYTLLICFSTTYLLLLPTEVRQTESASSSIETSNEIAGTTTPASTAATFSLSTSPTDSGVELMPTTRPWLPIGGLIWCVGAMYCIGRLIYGMSYGRRWKSQAIAAPDWVQQELRHLCASSRIQSSLEVRQCPEVNSPVLLGWLQPVILFPIALHAHLDPDLVRAILAHELAHFIRRDHWSKLFQQISLCGLYFHPAAWWISRIIDQEREHCADTLAVQLTKEPLFLAQALMNVEAFRQPSTPLTLTLKGPKSAFFYRIQRLFGEGRPAFITKTDQVWTLSLLLLIGLGISLSPQLVPPVHNTTSTLPSITTSNDSLSREQLHQLGLEPCRVATSIKSRQGKVIYRAKHRYTYDEQGREKRWEYYIDNGQLYYANESEYNEHGLRARYWHYDRNNKLDSYYIYEYSDAGHPTAVRHFLLDGTPQFYWLYQTDQAGRISQKDYFSPDGMLEYYALLQYDETGQNLRQDNYSPNHKLLAYQVESYDEVGNMIQFSHFNAAGKELQTMQYTYHCKN